MEKYHTFGFSSKNNWWKIFEKCEFSMNFPAVPGQARPSAWGAVGAARPLERGRYDSRRGPESSGGCGGGPYQGRELRPRPAGGRAEGEATRHNPAPLCEPSPLFFRKLTPKPYDLSPPKQYAQALGASKAWSRGYATNSHDHFNIVSSTWVPSSYVDDRRR